MPADSSQSAFAQALLDRASPPSAANLADPDGKLERRFAIHRNTLFAALVGVLTARFPAVRALTGDEFFGAMAAGFVSAWPPRTPVLLEYGEEFPRFIGQFAPAQDIPYLPDVAKWEWTLHDALHSADAPGVGIGALQTLDPDRVHAVLLKFHPAARLFSSPFPVLSIAKAAANPEGAALELSGEEYCLITRPDFECLVTPLDAPSFAIVSALAKGETFGQALASAAEGPGLSFDVANVLAKIFSAGAIISIARC